MAPKLRVKTGCSNCKARRKKCDEKKPVCSACARSKATCRWSYGLTSRGSTSSAEHSSIVPGSSTDVARRGLLRQAAQQAINVFGNGVSGFSDQQQLYYTIKGVTTLESLVPHSATGGFHDLSRLGSIAMEKPWMRNSLAAFAAYMQWTTNTADRRLEETALTLHSDAIHNLQRHLVASHAEKDDKLASVVAITFLGLFQNLGTGDPQSAVSHLLSAAQMCRSIESKRLDESSLRLYRVSVECWLFGLGELAIFYPDVETLVRKVDLSSTSPAFDDVAFLDTSTFAISPFFLGNQHIYILMIKITCFARLQWPADVRSHYVEQWAAELRSLENTLSLYYSIFPKETADLYSVKYLLHIMALRILLVKISKPESTAASPEVMTIVRGAVEVFRTHDIREKSNPACAWPLIIFLFAAHDQDMFEYLEDLAIRLRENFLEGHRVRFRALLTLLRTLRKDPECMPPGVQIDFGTLDILVRRNGLPFDQSSLPHADVPPEGTTCHGLVTPSPSSTEEAQS